MPHGSGGRHGEHAPIDERPERRHLPNDAPPTTVPMSLIRLRQVSKRYGRKQVLRDVFYRLAPGDRTGLLGRNGSGKTTVLRLILGREEPSEGEIEVAADLRIGYFSQFSELSGEASIESVLREVFESIRRIEANLADVARALAEGGAGDRQDRLLKRYEALTAEMERRDGWTYEHRIDNALSRLGFSRRHRTMPIDHLSGGWRNRAALARILLETPDVLLLDEPTNFLDFDGLAWLETWLTQFRGAALVVSHDRHFLDRAVNRVVEIQNHRFHEYECGFVEFVRRKRGKTRHLEREFRHEEELLAFEAEAIQDRREAARNLGLPRFRGQVNAFGHLMTFASTVVGVGAVGHADRQHHADHRGRRHFQAADTAHADAATLLRTLGGDASIVAITDTPSKPVTRSIIMTSARFAVESRGGA